MWRNHQKRSNGRSCGLEELAGGSLLYRKPGKADREGRKGGAEGRQRARQEKASAQWPQLREEAATERYWNTRFENVITG